MDVAAGIGAGHYLDPGGQGLVHRFPVNVHQGAGTGLHMRRAQGGVKLVNLKGRHQESALVRHHFQQVRVFGQIAAVFHGMGAGLDAHSQAGAAHGVAHGLAAQGGGLVNQGADFRRAKSNVQGAVSGAGTGPAGGGELDDVGPHPAHFPYLGPYRVVTVGHARGNHRVIVGVALSRGGNLVRQPAGGGNDGYGHYQARARVQSLLHRLLEAGIQPAAVPDAGIAGSQRLLQYLGSTQVL